MPLEQPVMRIERAASGVSFRLGKRGNHPMLWDERAAARGTMAEDRANLLRRIWVVVADSVGHLNADDGWAMASHVALSGLMALFPFLIFVAALAGFFGQEALAQQ